ncbi:mitochondrial peripheral inner membrane protein [Perkinsus chesapeaki]|uniref:Mitochondrial peripheral inner membrane protein n=1 Tax=Perkinsus chesapeaki TaxID=330153 RepID=A0A7J6MZD5_PERCH|nr:mitochondrial peripheral inner membrane protein [Perkinsus chesapeaki]
MSLIGEWPVDNYVLGLLILPLISRSKLQWPALAYPTVEEWALGSIALSSLLPAVGIQAVWLYVLGAILGNVICREMEAQAGIAAVISYLVGESMVFANHRNDFDGLTLLWFHDLGPSTFAVVYAVLASTTYVAFAPRCRRELMCLKRADWWVSCAAVDGPFMSDAPSSPRPVVLGTCPGEAARSYLAWLGPRATAAAYILQNELQAQDLPRPPEHTCVRTDPHKQTVGSTQELLTFDMDTLPRVGPEIITLPPSVPIAEHHHEPDSWSSWGSRASVSHPAVCEAHLPSPSLDPLVAPTILFLVYAAVLSRMSQEESPSAVAAACLAEVYTYITRNGAPCCRLAKTVLGAWKGGWGYCCFCEMKNLIVSAALSFPTESARLEVGSITPEAEDEASLVDAPSSRASVIAGNVPIEAAEPAPAAPPLSETKATTTELPSTAFRQDCVFCPLGESILAEHVALCTLARLQGTLPKNSLSKLEPVGDVDKGSNAPPNSSRLDITANRPRFQSSPELITAFDALLVQEAFLASLERRNRSSHQQWRRRSSRMKARPRSDMMPTRPLSSPGVAPRAYVRPFTPHDQLPYSLYVEKVENDFIATFCKSPRILPPHTVSRLESSSHMLARYILRDLYFTIGIIYALEGGRWPHPPSAEVGRKPSPGSLSAVTFRLTRISEPRPRSLGCQTDLAGLTGSMIDITLAAQSTTTAGRSEDVTVKSNEAHLVIADSMTISLQCMVHSKDAEEKTVQASRKAGHCNSNQKAEMPVVEMVSSAVQTMSPRQRLEAGTFCDLSNISVVPPDATSNTVVSRTPAGGNNHFKSNTVMEDDAMDLTAARRCSVEFVGYLMARCACRMMARSSLDSLFARIVAPARGTLPRAERVTGGSSVGIQCVDETHSDSTEFVPAYLTSPCNVACQTNSPRPSHLRLLLLMAAQRRLLSSGAVDRLRPAPEEAPASCGRRGGRNRQPPSSTPSVSNTAPPPGLAPATPCLLFETSSSVVSQELTSTYKSVATTLLSEVSTDCSAASYTKFCAPQSCLFHPDSPGAHALDDATALAAKSRDSLALMLPSLGEVLNHVVMLGDATTSSMGQGDLTRFHAVRIPGISIKDYLKRLAKHFNCSNACFIIALIYIDKLIKTRGESFRINSYSIHRVLLTSLLVATKFYDDSYYSNAYYAKVGGIRLAELNALEVRFLHLMKWSLVVDPEEYQQYKYHIVKVRLLEGNFSQPWQQPIRNPKTVDRRSSIASTVDPDVVSCCPPTGSSLLGRSPPCKGSRAGVIANGSGICCPAHTNVEDAGEGPFNPSLVGCHAALHDESIKLLHRQSPRGKFLTP